MRVLPDMRARAADNALTAPRSEISSSAEVSKYRKVSSGTLSNDL